MSALAHASKKRQASSQSGPKSKKTHFDKTVVVDKKKRNHPVTHTLKPDDDSATSSGDESEHEHVHNLDEEVKMDTEEDAALSVPPKDPNAARESHKAQKVLQDQRRAAKPHSALLVDAKQAWTLARQKDLTKQERTKNINALMKIIRGRVIEIVFKHDASRIVQTIVKHGGAKERNEIASELKGRYKELAQNKYSKFLVTKLIRLCPSHRTSILGEFQGSVMRLLLHREASSVLADAFELYANAYERTLLLRDFYGKEASLLTFTAGSDAEKEMAKKGLKGLIEEAGGERRKRIMSSLKANLVTIFNNPDKGAVSHAIVHRAMWEYLTAAEETPDEEEREKLRREMFESCQDVLAEIVHTKDGSRVVRSFIAEGTAKDRKIIVKALKPHIVRICSDDDAQLVLFTALDVIDDTKLTAKSFISDITASASKLYSTTQGRRALIYLICPRTRRHFTPAQIVTLAETDAARTRTSKKDEELRSSEIRRAASEELLAWVAKDGANVVTDPGGSLVVTEVMLYAEGDKSAASEALLTALTSPLSPHPISLPHTARMYKTLLQGGHFSHTANAVERTPHFSAIVFARRFMELVGQKRMMEFADGDGTFIVAALCETVVAEGEAAERETLKGWLKKAGTDGQKRGVAVLLKTIGTL